MAQLKVVSFGGGVQSTSLLVLAAQGELDIKTFLFANVGDDSEHSATLRYVREVAMPYAQQHGINIIEVQKRKRDGSLDTLLGEITKPGQKGDIIPVRLGGNGPAIRACTSNFKIRVIAKWLKAHGATKADPAHVALGISLDEFQRMKPSHDAFSVHDYPLIDRRLNRQDCMNIISRAGLPVPPKSSCWFCPFHRISRWQEMAATEPELFEKTVRLERFLTARRQRNGKDAVYFTDAGKPLDKVIGDKTQGKLFEADPGCDSGFCFL